MKKSTRDAVFKKFDGKCYLCGCELRPGWHIEHLVPCRRKYRLDKQTKKWVADGFENPEANHIDNLMPACASCNINKHSMDIETYRQQIQNFMDHLNNISTQYKLAKRFGLVQETGKSVVFYFETL